MKTIRRWILPVVILLVAACVPSLKTPEVNSSPTMTIEQVTSTVTLEPAATVEPELTINKLKNSTYFSPSFQKSVQLTNGEYLDGSNSIKMAEPIAMGDLNGDNIADAAVILAENAGGTGVFYSLVVIASEGDHFVQAGTILIDDRPIIKSLQIENGEVKLQATIHWVGDPMSDPSLSVKRTYRFQEEQLTLKSQTFVMVDGVERTITIDTPLDESVLNGSLEVKGSMPMAPFENNLRLTIYDLSGVILLQNGFMVTAADMGAPATFDNTITLPVLPSGSKVRLELAELSMVDGSVMDMNSVVVTIK